METLTDKTDTFCIGDVSKSESGTGWWACAVHYWGPGEYDHDPAQESYWKTKREAVAAVKRYHRVYNTGPHNFNVKNNSLY